MCNESGLFGPMPLSTVMVVALYYTRLHKCNYIDSYNRWNGSKHHNVGKIAANNEEH
jgi:hypothetical protein